MWLEARLALLHQHSGPIVLRADNRFGTSRLIAALDQEMPLIWLELDSNDSIDQAGIGAKVSDAVRHAFGSRLFPKGLPLSAALHILSTHAELLGPLVIAVSELHHQALIAPSFLALQQPTCKVVLAGPVADSILLDDHGTRPRDLLILDETRLGLTQDEAFALAPVGLASEQVLSCLERSHGAYETYQSDLHQGFGTPVQPVPSPAGARLPPGSEIAIDSEAVLSVLITKRDWLRAAEVAVTSASPHVLEVLREAAPTFHERGQHARLWQLLERLPEQLKAHPDLLYWRLSCAFRIGTTASVLPAVEAHLKVHEAPNLRALHAGLFLDVDTFRLEARRAYAASATPFTAYQLGFACDTASEGAEVLKGAVRLAEKVGRPYEVARNAGALASRLTDAGQYQEAAHWAGWAITFFDRQELADAQRRLHLVNEWAYARILTGETVGLEAILRESEAVLAYAFPSLRRLFRSTLGNFLMAHERPAEAIGYYRANWDEADRSMLGTHGLNLVHAFLCLDPPELEAARQHAEQAFVLTETESWEYHLPAVLALGMVLSYTQPAAAVAHLEAVLTREPPSLPVPYALQATLFLAAANLKLGRREEVQRLIAAQPKLRALSPTGLRLFSGKGSHFAEVLKLCSGDDAELELHFLGRADVTLKGKALLVSPLQRDILALLAYYPTGLAPEQLLAFLHGDSTNMDALYTTLSKLRRKVPISSRPYALTCSYRADFLDGLTLLRRGHLRQALEVYRGPLLPTSDAPEIGDLRAFIDASFREAVLASDDAEALIALATRTGDDYELWAAALEVLPQGDPRTPLLHAQATRVLREL